ncbi:MAG: RNA polymerase sigma factor [Pirellulaceae bacterium]|nr:RNA polymerase sigma factor [Pirellulaceae bacterium]
MKEQETDEQLMARVLRGDRQPLDVLVRRYANPLLTYLERMLLGDHHRAEELFQDVFLRIWTKRGTYRRGRPFRPWMFAIAANVCRTSLRKRPPPTPSGEVFEAAAAGPSPHESAVAVESANLVSQAIARLSERQRTVVVLRVWNGLPYAEIASAVGCTETTVRSHMHHGLATMRRFLEPVM